MARPANESALPFPPYSSFINFLNDLNAMEVLPSRLNQQVFSSSYSGSAKHQVLRAFRFFDLTNAEGVPNLERLNPLLDPERRKAALPALLREKYKNLIEKPLETLGPADFNAWFNDIGMDPATTGKAKSFFMSAARENGIKMHSLVAERAGRRGPTGPRKKRSKRRDADNDTDGTPGGGQRLDTGALDPVLAGLLQRVPSFSTVAQLDEWFKVYKTTFGYVKGKEKSKTQDEP
jgi:hypothetical protein